MKIHIEQKPALKAWGKSPDAMINQAIRIAMHQGGKDMVAWSQRWVSAGVDLYKTPYSRRLSVRSGALISSIGSRYFPSQRTLVFGAGKPTSPAAKYAGVHEFGWPSVRRPTSGRRQFLMIPLKPYLAKSGAMAQTPQGQQVWQMYDFNFRPIGYGHGKKRWDWTGTHKDRHRAKKRDKDKKYFPAKKKRNRRVKGYVAVEQTTNKAWFLLLRQVGPIPARPYLRPSIDRHMPGILTTFSQQLIKRMNPGA